MNNIINIEQRDKGIEKFLLSLSSLEKKNKTREMLDYLYDITDTLFTFGSFAIVNKMLKKIDVENTDIDILIGFLTTASCVNSKLFYYNEFFKKVEKHLKKSGQWEKDLLKGLESKKQ